MITRNNVCNVLGGKLPDDKQFRMKAPGARHHARWMSKVIYTIKIAMLKHQLGKEISGGLLKKIVELAQFLCLYYVKPWMRATLPVQAPIEDLNLYKMMLSNAIGHKSEEIQQLSQAVASKFENHFWYLTEHLVVLSLFSDASVQQKQAISRAMKSFKRQPLFKTAVPMPDIKPSTQLKDLVGPDSWLIFNLINEEPVFLSKSASLWEKDENYNRIRSRLVNMKVVNDSSERALRLVTEYHHSRITKSQDQKQFLYQVVKNLREKQASLLPNANAERYSKNILLKMW